MRRPPAWLVLELCGTVGVFAGTLLELILRKDAYLFVISFSSLLFAVGAKLETIRHIVPEKKEVK